MSDAKIFTTTELIEVIKNVLNSQRSTDANSISLYQVVNLIRNKNKEYQRLKELYNFLLKEHFISSKLESIHIRVEDFNYENNDLKIDIDPKGGPFSKYSSIFLKKENGIIYVKKTETDWATDVLGVLKDELSELYDKFLEFSNFRKIKKIEMNSLNCKFAIKIREYFTSIEAYLDVWDYFILKTSNHQVREYKYDGFISSDIISIIYGNEEQLLENILVKIDDLPEWMQSILYEIRRQELEELQRLESQERQRLLRNEKIKSIIRKILPFVK